MLARVALPRREAGCFGTRTSDDAEKLDRPRVSGTGKAPSLIPARGRSAAPKIRRSGQTTRIAGGGPAAAATGDADQARGDVGPGRDGPVSESNHNRHSLSGPVHETGSAKKDALRRCITTKGHRHVRVRRESDTYAEMMEMQ